MKQTATEWIEGYLKQFNHVTESLSLTKAFEKAKKMEKEQIIDAHFNGCEVGEMFNNENRAFTTDAEKYYKETFKSE